MESLSSFPSSLSPTEIGESNDPSSSSLSTSDTDAIHDVSLEEEDLAGLSDQNTTQERQQFMEGDGSPLSKDIEGGSSGHMPTIRLKLVNILKASNQPLLQEFLGKCILALQMYHSLDILLLERMHMGFSWSPLIPPLLRTI